MSPMSAIENGETDVSPQLADTAMMAAKSIVFVVRNVTRIGFCLVVMVKLAMLDIAHDIFVAGLFHFWKSYRCAKNEYGGLERGEGENTYQTVG
jgi:hypothetical protein